ncbi:von Willebrand factor-like isoform X2 [Ascaphus truei]|uniref:von Willebrand factor-like isoform X2 n=1 Tax=Ascaphus truei TaxID=8439 RepID=UPI003F5A4F86
MIYAYLLHISALPLVLLAGIKGPTCPPGAKWSSCTGCWSYCPIMEMACAASCKEGCSCEQKGYVIHEGACIPSSECPLIPRGGDRCPLDKVWNSCSDCGAFCPVKRKCQDVCRKGCVCKKRGYVLQKGACIPFSECSTSPPHEK